MTLDFCASCGTLLPIDEMPPSVCANCGNSVYDRERRVQGTFSDVEAIHLNTIVHGVDR